VTGSLAVATTAAAHAETTLPAVGVQRAAWLLLVFPLIGAVVLLLGGSGPTAGGTCWAWPCRWPRSSTR